MTKEEFKKFWDMIGSEKQYSMEFKGDQLYQGLSSLPGDISTYLLKNGFTEMASSTKQQTGQSMLYFGAKTVNNLPLLLEIAHPLLGDDKGILVTYKIPVPPLKPLFEDSIKALFQLKE